MTDKKAKIYGEPFFSDLLLICKLDPFCNKEISFVVSNKLDLDLKDRNHLFHQHSLCTLYSCGQNK